MTRSAVLGIITAVLCALPVEAKDCKLDSLCSCKFEDGSIVDLTSLGNTDDTPRFKDIKSASEGNFYSYSPCNGFTENTCSDAAVCILNPDKSESVQIGDAAKAAFKYDKPSGNVIAAYTSGGISSIKLSEIILKCDKTACEPKITADGQQGGGFFQMTLTTVCACPNGCTDTGPTNCSPEDGGGSSISVGTILSIAFSATLILYFVAGGLFLKFAKKKTGVEVVPNVLFWRSLPIHVKSGIYFLLGKCSPRFRQTTYDKI